MNDSESDDDEVEVPESYYEPEFDLSIGNYRRPKLDKDTTTSGNDNAILAF